MATPNHFRSRLILNLSCAASLAFALVGTTQADTIVRYDLNPPGSSGTSSSIAAVETHPDVTATPYTALAGSISNLNDNHFLNGGDDRNDTIDDAVTNDVAGTFTVTVSDGKFLNLDSLDFVFESSNAVADDSFAIHLRSSVDGFGSDIASVTRTNTVGTTTTNESFSLNIPALQGITGSIQFKLFLVSNADASTHYTRVRPDVVLRGAVVPEPGSIALAGLATLCVLMRRRAAA